MSADDILRASELGQYAYCARAWWLARVRGLRSANVAELEAGRDRHRAHGRAVQRLHSTRRLALSLLLLAGIALGVWLVLTLAT
jgi:CRISPR/Cas system-associated exonuclease Cas4 (RecB family)